jgi:hypothetical protein
MTRLSRREFIRMSACTLAAVLASGCASEASPAPNTEQPPLAPPAPGTLTSPPPTETTLPEAVSAPSVAPFLSLHPFVESHPAAVFIHRTDVPSKTDSQAKKDAGLLLASSLFTPGETLGIPMDARLAIKANLTCAEGKGNTGEGMGILTDRYFMEGMIEGLKSGSFPAGQVYLREGNWLGDGYCPADCLNTGYPEMAQSTGVNLLGFPTGKLAGQLSVASMEQDTEIVWVDVPDGVVFKRIPYVAPFNASDSWLLDVAKMKTHGMGVTLSTKNLQGMLVPPYTRFCEGVANTLQHPPEILANFQPDLESRVEELYQAHKALGYPRWDKPGRTYDSGYGMEMWCQRTCDSLSVSPLGLAIVESIYGRSGAFMEGSGPDGEAQDFLMNLVIFGKNPFLVDIVGAWLAGHEPGNLGLFHIACERGLSPFVNPHDIPLFLWDIEPSPASLASFERTPLLTPYLRQDYAGQNEPVWHMLDQPFNYA